MLQHCLLRRPIRLSVKAYELSQPLRTPTPSCCCSGWLINQFHAFRYTSEVYLKPGEQVISKVFDSTLFDHLDSTWDFKVGPSPSSTWLTFSVDFGFKSPLYRSVAAVFFEEVQPHTGHSMLELHGQKEHCVKMCIAECKVISAAHCRVI